MIDGAEILIARGLSKRFTGTQALENVDFSVRTGEIHTLVGENGAGKSTLIKILGGVHAYDSGELVIDGRPCRFATPREALAAGIVVIPQEMQLVPSASVAENVTLGDWPTRRWFGLLPGLDRRQMHERAAAALAQLDFETALGARVDSLSFAERQLVVIARALGHQARILILDEPTASLEQREAERLFATLAGLKESGVGIVFVSHRLDEVVQLADRCTTLRDGRVVDLSPRGAIDAERLVLAMTGRDLAELHRPHRHEFGDERLAFTDGVRDLAVRRGETIGLAGLLGSGTSGLLRDLYGAGEERASIVLDGRNETLGHPAEAIARGIGMVPGERRDSLVMALSIRDNIVLPHLSRLTRGGRLEGTAIDALVTDVMADLDIRPRDPRRPVRELSGGNQQKVIFARWLVGRFALLLLDEPTHGIDVGAKTRIHRLMHEVCDGDGSIMFTSSEMEEVVSMSDSVIALRQGKVVARMSRESGDYNEGVLRQALGG